MSENYTMVSVPKKTSNAGRPKGKKSYVMLFRWEDVKTCTRDEKGVKVTAFEMAEGKKPIAVYATDSTINIYHTSEGEDDARGFIHHVIMSIRVRSWNMMSLLTTTSTRTWGRLFSGVRGMMRRLPEHRVLRSR